MSSFFKLPRKRQQPGRPDGGRAPEPSSEGHLAGRVRRQDEGGRTFEAVLEKSEPLAVCRGGYCTVCCSSRGVGVKIDCSSFQNCVQHRRVESQISS